MTMITPQRHKFGTYAKALLSEVEEAPALVEFVFSVAIVFLVSMTLRVVTIIFRSYKYRVALGFRPLINRKIWASYE